MTAVLALEPLARTSEGSKAGPIGLGVILLLCIACYFLFKSMSKHMRYVRENFPGSESAAVPGRTLTPEPTGGPESSGTAESVRLAESTDPAEPRLPTPEA